MVDLRMKTVSRLYALTVVAVVAVVAMWLNWPTIASFSVILMFLLA